MRPIVRVLKHASAVFMCPHVRSIPLHCNACEKEHTEIMVKHHLSVEAAREELLITWHYNGHCGWTLTSRGIDIFNQLNGDFK